VHGWYLPVQSRQRDVPSPSGGRPHSAPAPVLFLSLPLLLPSGFAFTSAFCLLPSGFCLFFWLLVSGFWLVLSSPAMPKRTDLTSILIIGSGPIIIGQAVEFDYSGTQACKALREEGYRIILVNSNPATIMTDMEFADRTYIEPLTVGDAREDHRARAARRDPADGRRSDRDQPRDGASRGGASSVRRRADRGELRSDATRPRIGSCSRKRWGIGVEVARSGYAASLDEALELIADPRLPGHRPSFVHSRRQRRRHRLQRRGVPGDRHPRAWSSRPCTRC
jgi:hypothetical protein